MTNKMRKYTFLTKFEDGQRVTIYDKFKDAEMKWRLKNGWKEMHFK